MNNNCLSDPISVCILSPNQAQDWNRYVANSGRTTFAHQLRWKSVVEDAFGHQALYLMAYRQEQLVGILPLVLIKSFVFGRFLTSSPFLTYGGIVCDNEDVEAALILKAYEIAQKYHVEYVEIRNDSHCRHIPHTKSDYCSLTLDLSPGADYIWNNSLRPSARRNVRRANKTDFELVHGYSHLKAFTQVFARNMHRLGTPTHSRFFFEKVFEHFPETTLFALRKHRTVVGGALLVPFKNTVLMPWISSRQEHFSSRPNNLLYWEAIRWTCQNGYQKLDFGRSKWDSGTFRFKAQYGAKPIQLHYQYLLHKTRKIPCIDPTNVAFQSAISLWRRLPLPVANILGPHIVRSIP